ncbi:MAG: hypothetical protein OEY00_08170 [Gammaproteobacteria bacterium]|nr:hypothetical protein [Gammaproteobacteria bacterium]
MKILSIITIALLFSGCAVMYTPPKSGPVAKIQFKNDAQRKLLISFFDVSTNCKGRRNIKPILPNNEATHSIPAGKEITFQYYLTNFNGFGGEAYCLMNLRFFAKPNNNYIFKTSEDSNSCKWYMTNETNKEKPIKIKLKALEWIRGFNENSSFCDG